MSAGRSWNFPKSLFLQAGRSGRERTRSPGEKPPPGSLHILNFCQSTKNDLDGCLVSLADQGKVGEGGIG